MRADRTDDGCDLFISHEIGTVPLWREGSGVNADGLDFLMSRGKEWCAQRKRERTLKPGDRIAVLGCGVAVVKRVDDKHIYAVLWNRSGLTIRRSEIVWAEQNMRWEAKSK